MNFQTLSQEGKNFISRIQFSNKGMSLESSIGIALALAFKNKCVDPLYYDLDMSDIKMTYRKQEEFKNTEILNNILSLVPVDYRFILELTNSLFVIRVKASKEPYNFLTLFSKNDDLVHDLDEATKKVMRENIYDISVLCEDMLSFIKNDLKV